MAWMSSWDGPLGPGLPFFRAENSNRYLRFLSALWSLSIVDGLMITAARKMCWGLMKSDQKLSKNRSSADRLGARCRERLITRSCCFMRRLSATTAFAPPGPMILARVVNRCMRSTIKSFMGKQGRVGRYQAQGLLSVCFHAGSKNSPPTPEVGFGRLPTSRTSAFFAVALFSLDTDWNGTEK